MTPYEEMVRQELNIWQQQMLQQPSQINRLTKLLQKRINRIFPEPVHQAMTFAIREMTRAVLFGAEFTTQPPVEGLSLQERETKVLDRIYFYKKTAAAEGGLTGAAGFLVGLADFPLLIGLKIKLLYEIATLYGYSVGDYRERLFVLSIFQLSFSSKGHRRKIYQEVVHWREFSRELPNDIRQFDWRTFQEEYRDYIDLAKLAQLMPGIGAAVGLVVNYRLIDTLGRTAMNAYRVRWFEDENTRLSGHEGQPLMY